MRLPTNLSDNPSEPDDGILAAQTILLVARVNALLANPAEQRSKSEIFSDEVKKLVSEELRLALEFTPTPRQIRFNRRIARHFFFIERKPGVKM